VPYRELVPHPSLRPFVDRLWIRAGQEQKQEQGELRILPDGCIDVIVSLDQQDTCFVVGAMTSPLVVPATARAQAPLAAVRFRPGGAAPFLRVGAYDLTDRRVEAAALGVAWLSPRQSPLAGARSPTAVANAARALEEALLARLGTVPEPDRRVAWAVRSLFAPPPSAAWSHATIAGLARSLGWSRQHLGRMFRVHVGIGPKELAKVARVQRAVARVQGPHSGPLAGAAVELGYFDEAHMDRDFRDLVGVTPVAVRGAAGSIRPIPSLWNEA
jgi:AraC-like DNA-binding protein